MKNAILILLALVALVSLQAFGQTPANGKISLGFGAEGAVPLGDFSNASNFGIGGLATIAYPVDPSLTLTGKAGYMSFSSKVSCGPALERGIVLYQLGIDKFIGNCLIKRLENQAFHNVEELQATLRPDTRVGPGKWIDLAGMLAPEEMIQQLLADIESGAVSTLEQLDARFAAIHENYSAYEWAWAVDLLQKQLGKTIDEITFEDIIHLTERWKEAVLELDHRLFDDTKKEFAATAQIGFGLDGDSETKQSDFAAVRGTFEADGFVTQIEKHIATKSKLAEELLGRIEPLCRHAAEIDMVVR
jgi:hypothetical protein